MTDSLNRWVLDETSVGIGAQSTKGSWATANSEKDSVDQGNCIAQDHNTAYAAIGLRDPAPFA